MDEETSLPESPRADEGADRAPDAAATRADRPLGYWLRLVDALITREFASTLEDEGVGRRDWMLLNALAGAVDPPGLAERLAQRGKRLRGLEERGWVARQDDGWTLTDEGRAERERLSGLVAGIREKVAGALSPDEHAALTASLETIARGLGWDESAEWPDRGLRGPRFGGFGPRHRRWPGFAPAAADPADGHARPRRPLPMDDPDRHRGLGRGEWPRHPHGHSHGRGHAHAHGYGYGYGYGYDGHGCRDAHHEHPQHHEHAHHRRDGGKGRHAAERAYERGFAAGFGAAARRPEGVDPAA